MSDLGGQLPEEPRATPPDISTLAEGRKGRRRGGAGGAQRRLMANSALVSVLTVVGLATGFLSTAVVAMRFGISGLADAFYTAWTIPAIFASLLTVASNSALVPALARRAETDGEAGAWELFNVLLTVQVLLLSLVSMLAILAAPLIVGVMTPGFDPAQRQLTVGLSRVMFVTVVFYAITATTRAFLYSRRVYGPPTLLIAASDIVAIVLTLGGAATLGIGAAAAGVLAGAFYQSTVALVLLARYAGFHYRPSLNIRVRGFREGLGMFGALLVGSSSRRLVTIVERFLASFLPAGTISALSIGNKLNMMVGGIFFSSLTTAILPDLSAGMVRESKEKVREMLVAGIRLITLMSVPVTVGLLLIRIPLVRALFQRGAVTPEQTALVAGILGYYLVSIAFMGYFRLAQNFLYSAVSGRSASGLFLLAGASNLILDLVLVRVMGAYGIALAWTLSLIVVSAAGFILLQRSVPGVLRSAVSGYAVRVGAAAAMMALAMTGANRFLVPLLPHLPAWRRFGTVGIVVGAGGVVFIACAAALRIEELYILLALVRRRVGRVFRPASSPAR